MGLKREFFLRNSHAGPRPKGKGEESAACLQIIFWFVKTAPQLLPLPWGEGPFGFQLHGCASGNGLEKNLICTRSGESLGMCAEINVRTRLVCLGQGYRRSGSRVLGRYRGRWWSVFPVPSPF